MSKTDLKRLLNEMSREQLIDLILEHYSARKDAKAYLDYYVNPDTDKLIDAFEKEVRKEFGRVKYGTSRVRISMLKRIVKDFESYQPGYELVMSFVYNIIRGLINLEYVLTFPETLVKGTQYFVQYYLDYGNKHFVLDKALNNLMTLLENERNGHRYFRRMLSDHINDYMQESSKKIK